MSHKRASHPMREPPRPSCCVESQIGTPTWPPLASTTSNFPPLTFPPLFFFLFCPSPPFSSVLPRRLWITEFELWSPLTSIYGHRSRRMLFCPASSMGISCERRNSDFSIVKFPISRRGSSYGFEQGGEVSQSSEFSHDAERNAEFAEQRLKRRFGSENFF